MRLTTSPFTSGLSEMSAPARPTTVRRSWANAGRTGTGRQALTRRSGIWSTAELSRCHTTRLASSAHCRSSKANRTGAAAHSRSMRTRNCSAAAGTATVPPTRSPAPPPRNRAPTSVASEPSASISARSGSRWPSSSPTARYARQRWVSASSRTAATSVDLPMPGSPSIQAVAPRPAFNAATAPRSVASSPSRPTSDVRSVGPTQRSYGACSRPMTPQNGGCVRGGRLSRSVSESTDSQVIASRFFGHVKAGCCGSERRLDQYHVTRCETEQERFQITIADVAHAWATALTGMSSHPVVPADVELWLAGLTERLSAALQAQPFTAEPAYKIGAELVEAHLTDPEVLTRTVVLLAQHLPYLAGSYDTELWLRLVRLLGALSAGFARALRRRALAEQELFHRTTMAGAVASVGEERLQAVFAVAPVGMALCDADGRILEANRCLADLLGYDAEELRGADLLGLVDRDEVAEVSAQVVRLLGGHGTRHDRALPAPAPADPSGVPRPVDRPAQPRAVCRTHSSTALSRTGTRFHRRAVLCRPRRLQGGERQSRVPCRRSAAGRCGRPDPRSRRGTRASACPPRR